MTDTADELATLRARVQDLEAWMQQIDDLFSDAAQSDCENGVRSLNEKAAAEYLAQYPATGQAIRETVDIARAALEEKP